MVDCNTFARKKEKVTIKVTNGSGEKGRQECRDGFKEPHPVIPFSVVHSIGTSFVDATLRERNRHTDKLLLWQEECSGWENCKHQQNITWYCETIYDERWNFLLAMDEEGTSSDLVLVLSFCIALCWCEDQHNVDLWLIKGMHEKKMKPCHNHPVFFSYRT